MYLGYHYLPFCLRLEIVVIVKFIYILQQIAKRQQKTRNCVGACKLCLSIYEEQGSTSVIKGISKGTGAILGSTGVLGFVILCEYFNKEIG